MKEKKMFLLHLTILCNAVFYPFTFSFYDTYPIRFNTFYCLIRLHLNK